MHAYMTLELRWIKSEKREPEERRIPSRMTGCIVRLPVAIRSGEWLHRCIRRLLLPRYSWERETIRPKIEVIGNLSEGCKRRQGNSSIRLIAHHEPNCECCKLCLERMVAKIHLTVPDTDKSPCGIYHQSLLLISSQSISSSS